MSLITCIECGYKYCKHSTKDSTLCCWCFLEEVTYEAITKPCCFTNWKKHPFNGFNTIGEKFPQRAKRLIPKAKIQIVHFL